MVLSFVPASEEEYRTLFNVHKLFDEVVKLPYFLRPHVTLDYFLPRPFSEVDKQQLSKTLIEINKEELPSIELDLYKLYYQYFYSMDDYRNMDGIKN